MGPTQESAFTALKGYPSKLPILKLPDCQKQFMFQTDAF